MSEEIKAPKAAIESEPAPAAAPAPAPEAPKEPAREPFSAGKAAGKASAWLKRTFPGNENAAIFGAIGLLAAVLIFIVGIWRALIVALFVVAGVAMGQVVDGDPKILRAIQRFISDRRG